MGFNPITLTVSENSNYWRKSLLEVIRQNIAVRCQKTFENKKFVEITQQCFALLLQGQPLGFDTKYLALADRNMKVRFGLKVVWES